MVHVNADRKQSGPRKVPVGASRDVKRWKAFFRRIRRNVDFGVVVGIEDYPYFRSLRGAANDARNFRNWLCDKNGGGLKKKNTKLILSDRKQKTPVQDEIDQMLLEVLDAADACGGARRLYFYFSGHGAMNPERSGNDIALLLTRWSSSLARLALSTDHYSSALCGAGLFEEVAIFVDCCRSPSVSAVGVPPTITRVWKAPSSTRKFIAFATESRHPAFEFLEPDSWQGIFTRCLLSILGRTPNGVHAHVLKELLESEVEKEARRLGVRQRAYADNGLHNGSCFGLGGRPPFVELRFAKRRGQVVLRRGDLQIVARHKAGDKPWGLSLPVGLYQIEGGGQDAVCFEHDGWKVSLDV
jgi:hypothetical protein